MFELDQVNGINRTLQALMDYVVASLNQMADDGIRISELSGQVDDSLNQNVRLCKFVVMHYKGDWKYAKQICNLRRHAQTERICWMCLAAKGRHFPEFNFTDLRNGSAWQASVGTAPPPWFVPPSIAKRRHFGPSKISLGILHVWHLGVARDMSLVIC